jgi:peptidoglycan/LPS O-acetylase OafA/YrhL
MKRFELLDGLRALAITFVVITHYANRLLPGGSIGVSIFFVLSGFLIATILMKRDVSVTAFFVRRFFKIYPAFITILIVQYLLSYYIGLKYFPAFKESLTDLALFIRMPEQPINMGVGIFWTIQIEVTFYILVPLVLRSRFVIKNGVHLVQNSIKIIWLLILISYVVKAYCLYRNLVLTNSIFALSFWMDGLLYGVLVACLLSQSDHNEAAATAVFNKTPRTSNPLSARYYLLGAASVLCLLAVFVPSEGSTWPIESSIASAITAGLIFVLRGGNHLGFSVPRPVIYVATVSYSAYLCHAFPLDYLYQIPTGHSHTKALAAIFAVVGSTLTLHYLIERPGMAFGKTIEKRVPSH